MPNWGAVFGWHTYNKTNATKVIRIVGMNGQWPRCQCACAPCRFSRNLCVHTLLLLVVCVRMVSGDAKQLELARA